MIHECVHKLPKTREDVLGHISWGSDEHWFRFRFTGDGWWSALGNKTFRLDDIDKWMLLPLDFREQAKERINEILNGSGVWPGSYPKKLRGKTADFSDTQFRLGMEYGVIHGLLATFGLSLADIGEDYEDTRTLNWRTGNWE